MQDTQNANCVAKDLIRRNIGCARDNQFPCPLDASDAAYLRVAYEIFCRLLDSFVDFDCGTRAVSLDVIEDSIAVSKC